MGLDGVFKNDGSDPALKELIHQIIMVIFNKPNLTHLDLKKCDLSLIPSFPISNELQSLNLSHCSLTDKAVILLASCLANSSNSIVLKSLKLSENSISTIGLNSILGVLHCIPSLKELDFQDNVIKDKGTVNWHHISDSRVERLYFGFCALEVPDALIHYLNNSYVRYLDMDLDIKHLSELNGTCIIDRRFNDRCFELTPFLD